MVISEKVSLSTKGNGDIVDITLQVAEKVAQSGLESGTVTLFISGSTAGLTTIEYEPGLIADLKEMWRRLVPEDISYQHDQRWGDGNGHAHVRASLLGASLVIPFVDKMLALGTWQQVVVVDFDNRPRSRQVILQIMGK
jgi:secondary thiamine-phosphate synthase enzyme